MTLKEQEIIRPDEEKTPVSKRTMFFLVLALVAIALIAFRFGRKRDEEEK